ncbi:calpain-like cysteine peptidase, putative [Leishmania tarentolae]|uniref:Calpain-like cysteine peptidase, putative n=1 Tax=Leishmania tarentolae TaxID=5689 RepID=A0A640KG62_LEITA|nr:calpain-like cysteine peptidase, putative [Leishmania tarentolae]
MAPRGSGSVPASELCGICGGYRRAFSHSRSCDSVLHGRRFISAVAHLDVMHTPGSRAAPPPSLSLWHGSACRSPRKPVTEAVLNCCVTAKILFVDAEFLAGEMAEAAGAGHPTSPERHDGTPFTSPLSLSHYPNDELEKPVVWARASDLVRGFFGEPSTHSSLEPHVFFLSPLSPAIIEPSELGDNWVIGTMAAVAEHKHHLLRIVHHPRSQQRRSAEQLLGAYRVTLNMRGWWRSVVINDYFPITEGGSYIRCAHSRRDVRALWVPLLEKVYAKMCGAYCNIISGDPLVALRDFTSSPCARYDISHFNNIGVASFNFAS